MIHLSPYRSEWPNLYQQEEQKLLSHAGRWIHKIEHIGSTAIPDLMAKPVIDIMVGVKSLAIADQYIISIIIKLGYDYISAYEQLMPERRYFQYLNHQGKHTHHIHLVETDSEFWQRHLLFRDYLRAHPHALAQYVKHKRTLANQFNDTNAYAAAKTPFIKAITQYAKLWQQRYNKQ